MALNDSDKFLVNDGTKTETITFAQFQDGTVLNDSDKFLVNDGTKTETITWAELQDELCGDVINFDAVITDDGTPEANTPGHVLTASAQNITGGIAPVEFAYEWIVDNLTMGNNKTLNIINTFVGKIVTCKITVAEPDGSNPVTKTAIYEKVIEIAGTIDTPTVLKPEDGAGSGQQRYLKSDTIIEVEDVGNGQTKLTVAGSEDLDDMTGSTIMTDGTGAPGPYSQTPYKLTTTDIESATPTQTVTFDCKGDGDGSLNEITEIVALRNSWDGLPETRATNTPVGNNLPNNGGDKVRVFRSANPPGAGGFKIGLAGYSGPETDHRFYSSPTGEANTWTFLGVKTRDEVGQGVSIPEAYGMMAFIGVTSHFSNAGYTCTDSEAQTVLTFPGDVSTNPDLQYFRAGDTVAEDTSTPGSYTTYAIKNSTTSNIQEDIALGIDFNNPTETIQFGNSPTVDINNLSSIQFDFGVPTMSATFGSLDYLPNQQMYLYSSETGAQDSWDSEGYAFTDSDGKGTISTTRKRRYYKLIKYNNYGTMGHLYWGVESNVTVGIPINVISTGYPNSNTMVVDGGTWNNGDIVEYQTNGGQGDIVSVNTDDNTILLSDTGDRDNRWIAENKAGTDFAVAGPSIVDDPLLTADVRLESSPFATTPPGVDGLAEIVWDINGVEQSAGTNNPYTPTNLPLNSQVTVKVKHKGAKLPDSEWSSSITFTTGASRTLSDYYLARIAELGG